MELDGPERQPAPKANVAFHLDDDRSGERGAGDDGMSEPPARRLGETSGHDRIEATRVRLAARQPLPRAGGRRGGAARYLSQRRNQCHRYPMA